MKDQHRLWLHQVCSLSPYGSTPPAKQAPCMSGQTAVRRAAFSCTHRNIPTLTVVIAARILATISSILMAATVYTFSFRCPHRKKSNRVRSGDRGGYVMSPPHTIHLSEQVACNHSRTFRHTVAGFRRTWTITRVAQLGTHLQTIPADHNTEKHIVEHPASA
jgi:hypothetical protein